MSRTKQFVLIIIALTAMNASAQVGEGIHKVGECYVGGTYVHQTVKVVGDVMYATNHYGIEIWDLDDPANPELFRTMPFRRPILGGGPSMGSGSRPQIIIRDDLMIIGTHIYLWIFDISDPFNPQLLSETQGQYYEWTSQIHRTALYCSGFSEMVLIDNTLVTFSYGNNLSCIDISDPANPEFVDEVILVANENALCGSGQIVEYEGQVLVVGVLYSEEFAVITFDLEDSQFELVADAHFEAPHHPVLDNQGEVVVHGDELIYTILDDAHKLHAIDISNIEEPSFIGTVELQMEFSILMELFHPLLELRGDILYYYNPYICGIINLENGFDDLTLMGDFFFFEFNPDDRAFNPALVWDIAITETELTAIDKFGAMKVFDVSVPEDVAVLFDNSEDPDHRGRPIVVQFDRKDDVLYCGSQSAFSRRPGYSVHRPGNCYMISIADLARPSIIDERLLDVYKSFAYVHDDSDTLVVIWNRWGDPHWYFTLFVISNPENPRIFWTYLTYVYLHRLIDVQQDVGVLAGPFSAQLGTADLSDLIQIEALTETFLDSMPYDEQRHNPNNNALVDGNELFFCGSGWEDNPEIYLYDIEGALNSEDPSDPELVECFDLSPLTDSLDVVFALEVQDTVAYVITGRQMLNGRMMTPWSQKLVITSRQFDELYSETELLNSGGPLIGADRPYKWQITVRDSLAYLLSDINGLYVYDVSEISQPAELIGWYDTPGEANQISFVDSLILIADTWSLLVLQLGEEPEREFNQDVSVVPDDFTISAVYPNPFNGMLTVAVEVPHPGVMGFTVFDITGRIIINSVFSSSKAGSVEHNLDLSSQSSGIYIVRVSTQWGDKFRRVVLLK